MVRSQPMYMPIRPPDAVNEAESEEDLRSELRELTRMLDTQDPSSNPPGVIERMNLTARRKTVKRLLAEIESRRRHQSQEQAAQEEHPAVTVHAGPCGGRIEYVTQVTRRDSRGEPMEIVRVPRRRTADPNRTAQAEISRMRAEVRAMGARLDADREAMERAGLVRSRKGAEGSTQQFLSPAGDLVTMRTSEGSTRQFLSPAGDLVSMTTSEGS